MDLFQRSYDRPVHCRSGGPNRPFCVSNQVLWASRAFNQVRQWSWRGDSGRCVRQHGGIRNHVHIELFDWPANGFILLVAICQWFWG